MNKNKHDIMNNYLTIDSFPKIDHKVVSIIHDICFRFVHHQIYHKMRSYLKLYCSNCGTEYPNNSYKSCSNDILLIYFQGNAHSYH